MQNCVGESLYKRRKASSLNLILNIIILIFIIVFIVELIFNSIFANIYVKGSSMLPTLTGAPAYGGEVMSGGDYVFVNTQAQPDYFDIVVVETVDAQGVPYEIIKRAIAFGGDTVKMELGRLSIKFAGDSEFTEINEEYLSEDYVTWNKPINSFAEHYVEEGYMFLLGDNRDVSEDSRRRGDFPLDSLVGVVPKWSLKYKSIITSFYTFFEFKLRLNSINGKTYGD